MKIKTLYDQGTASFKEDMLVCNQYDGSPDSAIMAAVLDGVSGLHTPLSGPKLFRRDLDVRNLTGGQLVCETTRKIICGVSDRENLEYIIGEISRDLRMLARLHKIPLWQSDILPGAAFVFTLIGTKVIRIIQGADCFAMWLSKGGTIGATRNQVFSHEQEIRQTIKELMRKHNQDRNKMWEELSPILAKARLDRVNKEGGYALLNGQSEVEKYWQEITLYRDEIRLLLLFSDGLVPFFLTEDAQALAEMVVPLYLSEGLRGILRMTREIEEKEKATSHIDHGEATAIAIEF